MEIRSVFQIAKREWENVSISLEECGEIGTFDLTHYVETRPELIRNLIGMEKKLHTHDYLTREAAYVFTVLGKEAGARLGLGLQMSNTFGSGYSWVRTGWFDLVGLEYDYIEQLEDHLTRKILFFMLFYPGGEDFGWVFDSPSVVCNLKTIFRRFMSWQEDPYCYERDVKLYETRMETLREGLTTALDADSGRC